MSNALARVVCSETLYSFSFLVVQWWVLRITHHKAAVKEWKPSSVSSQWQLYELSKSRSMAWLITKAYCHRKTIATNKRWNEDVLSKWYKRVKTTQVGKQHLKNSEVRKYPLCCCANILIRVQSWRACSAGKQSLHFRQVNWLCTALFWFQS